MNNRTHAIASILLAALASIMCSKPVDPPAKEKLHPLEIKDLMSLKTSKKMSHGRRTMDIPMIEPDAKKYFKKLAPGNSCKWGEIETLQDDDEKCPKTQKNCEFPQRFSLGGIPAGVTLSFRDGYCNNLYELEEVIIEVEERAVNVLIERLKKFHTMPYHNIKYTIRDKGKWMEHSWNMRDRALPEYVFRTEKSKPYDVYPTETYEYPATQKWVGGFI